MQDHQKVLILAKEISGNTTLEMLNLQKKDLQPDSARIIFDVVITHPSITHVDLSCNRIAGSALISLIKLIQSTTKIISLDLGFNCFAPADIKMIFNAVSVSRGLRRLILNNAQLDDTCAESLQHLLEKNNQLEHLELQYTKLTDRLLNAIALGLSANTGLMHLNLHGNHFSDAAASELALALKQNKTLLELKVGGDNLWVLDHRITSSALQYFVEALPHNVMLQAFRLGDTSNCSGHQVQAIKNIEARNIKYSAAILGILIKARIDSHENDTPLRWLPKELLSKILQFVYPRITLNVLEKLGNLLFFKPSTPSSSLNQVAVCSADQSQLSKL